MFENCGMESMELSERLRECSTCSGGLISFGSSGAVESLEGRPAAIAVSPKNPLFDERLRGSGMSRSASVTELIVGIFFTSTLIAKPQ